MNKTLSVDPVIDSEVAQTRGEHAEGSKPIRTRFAPSPTGFLHVGGLRTALYNYLFAAQNNGQFILRIEDTDQARLVPGAEENIVDTLQTFGLNFSEGPLRQSGRMEIYKKAAHELLKKELAYEDEGAIRFRMPKEGVSKFTDIIRGDIEIANKDQEDFIILKSDGYPTYNLAHLVDDHDMNITHVIRGEEFIPSMPKYIALHQAFGWEAPQYAHLPLLLNTKRAKLSKREGDVSVKDFLSKGYLVPALLNFVALLGWHPSKSDKEIFTLEELLKDFKLEEVQKAGAIFDLEKLNWFQHVWATKISEDQKPEEHPLYQRVRQQHSDEKFLDILWPHILERLSAPENYEQELKEFDFFFQAPEYDAKMLVWKKSDAATTKSVLEKEYDYLKKLPDDKWGRAELENSFKEFIVQNILDNGTALWPLRVALSGRERSMGPFEILDAFNRAGKRAEALERIITAAKKITLS